MNVRRWLPAIGMAISAFAGSPTAAQVIPNRMYVVIRFEQREEPWDLSDRIRAATAMTLVGISPSTHSAVFMVPNETNYATGERATRNQSLILSSFPGAVVSYNYGRTVPMPADLQTSRPDLRGGRDDGRRGPDDRPRRGPPDRSRFGERERLAVRDWYNQTQAFAAQLRVGRVLDPAARARGQEPTLDLARRLPNVPREYRFLVFASTLVLVDGQNEVVEIVQLDR